MAANLGGLASIFQALGRCDAESLLRQSLAFMERALERWHSNVASALANLGSLYFAQPRYANAAPYLRRALSIRERDEADHPNLAADLTNLAVGRTVTVSEYLLGGRTGWSQSKSETFS